MTQVLPKFQFAKKSYPWTLWMDGRVYRAVKGKDFACTEPGFMSTLYGRASRFNMQVTTTVVEKGAVDFQFIKPTKASRKKRAAKSK